MGVEDFNIYVNAPPAAAAALHARLVAIPELAGASGSAAPGEYFELRDGCVIEFAFSRMPEGNATLSCRFALCNPSVVEDRVAKIIQEISAHLPVTVELGRPVPPRLPSKFKGDEWDDDAFRRSFHVSLEQERQLWQRDFGTETAALNSGEALRRFVLHESV